MPGRRTAEPPSESKARPRPGWLATLLLAGGAGQVALAEYLAEAARAAIPTAVGGVTMGAVALVLLITGRWSAGHRLGAWVASGVLLAVASGAWAFLPAAWAFAIGCWRRDSVLRPPPSAFFLLQYLLGFAGGIGLWALYISLRWV
jgi:hypothetical protein